MCIRDRRSGNRLWLSAQVEDTGAGITDQEQEQLFEPFSQAKGGLNTQEGTGLGLAISRQYARLMGGDLTVSKMCIRDSRLSSSIISSHSRWSRPGDSASIASMPARMEVSGV